MKPKVKKELLRRLRSGDYPQGKDFLRRKDGDVIRWCFQGILCDIVEPDGWDTQPAADGGFRHRNTEAPWYAATLPSLDVQRAAGIWFSDIEELVIMNDHESKTFHEIANRIEVKF